MHIHNLVEIENHIYHICGNSHIIQLAIFFKLIIFGHYIYTGSASQGSPVLYIVGILDLYLESDICISTICW